MARTAAFNESANKGHAEAISLISPKFCESICECAEGFREKITDFVGFESPPLRQFQQKTNNTNGFPACQ
jgi:hypothetical protein